MPNPSADGIRAFGLPAVQKAERGGYDGRGVALIRTESDLDDLLPGPSFVEAFVPHQMELGVMVAITPDGESDTWPVAEMHFNPQGNLLDYLVAPARIPADVAERAQELAFPLSRLWAGLASTESKCSGRTKANCLERDGTADPQQRALHDGCLRDLAVRAAIAPLLGLPLRTLTLNSKATMVNLLGAQGLKPQSLKAPTSLTTTRMCTSICTGNTTVGSCEDGAPDSPR